MCRHRNGAGRNQKEKHMSFVQDIKARQTEAVAALKDAAAKGNEKLTALVEQAKAQATEAADKAKAAGTEAAEKAKAAGADLKVKAEEARAAVEARIAKKPAEAATTEAAE
jgi:hypothetical protein